MNQQGGYVESGFTVRILKSLFARGSIIYTTDGTDPRLVGGEMSPSALEFTTGFPLTEPTTVKTRVMNSDGWSAIAEARFIVDQVAASAENLTISKVHYRPAAASAEEMAAGHQSRKDFEFIELLNLSEETIDLHGARFN
ncbi:MAG: chitobiase/beta-hexosaminidase C-terminal domain-containing protein, partial [Verrucomicrobiales bacterium]